MSSDQVSLPDIVKSRPAAEQDMAQEVAEIVSHLLGDRRSIIDPSVEIWTAKSAEDLRARIEDDPIFGGSMGQWKKLDIQLADAPREVVLLAAELVFLREVPVLEARPATRKAHVEQVLSHLDTPVELPQVILQSFERPSGDVGFRAGRGFNGRLWLHLAWAFHD